MRRFWRVAILGVTAAAFYVIIERHTLFHGDEGTITVKVPAASSSAVVIRIDDGGSILISDELLAPSTDHDLSRVASRLQLLVASTPAKPVLIVEPAITTKMSRVIEVLDLCSFAGVKDVTLGNSPGPGTDVFSPPSSSP
jgi:biopolymer transport protein ExbD